MRVAILVFAIVAVALVITVIVAATLSAISRPGEERRVLNTYTKLTLMAARASHKGRTGESNIYQESADRMLEAWQDKYQEVEE